ncbi:sigma-54 interaction domain-containing protein [Desulfopila inferna]|uniref:sigma-54 interaction domain-containing protein n=1 Tax=Desulfopila inferna TaxID=468528 RepID=UPI001962D832|nr:sigma 54-interacting transcriptional regulator [Desulfopila inferna]MBM9603994.1 sigma 54-interacting transcriptional regulator [Desulfopila inferna]
MIGRELEGYWKTVVDTIRDGIMIVNTHGAIVSVNKAFEKITGYTRAEIIGKSCEILQCDICADSRALGEDQWCALFRYGEVEQRKCTVRRKDGTFFQALKNAAILKDADNNVIGAVGTIADISDIAEKENQIEAFRRQLHSEDHFQGIIGVSARMHQVFDMIRNAAGSNAPVIIYGESGTGKELVSRAIHNLGLRKDKPFIKVNCAALTESLLESELFGHVRGAYTGAYKDRVGRFEKANEGNIFLDEIGDLPISTQTKLLRVLEEKVIERVGSSSPIRTDVRIISATNQDLMQLVERGDYRKDFYFRINVIPIFLPPLRHRVEDIPLLAESFLKKMILKDNKTIKGISKDTVEILMNHSWPGNVRELKGAFEYAFVTCHEEVIQPQHLPETIYKPRRRPPSAAKKSSFNMQEIERRELLEILKRTGGNQSKAADILGVSRVTIWNRMKRHGIDAKRLIEVREEVNSS